MRVVILAGDADRSEALAGQVRAAGHDAAALGLDQLPREAPDALIVDGRLDDLDDHLAAMRTALPDTPIFCVAPLERAGSVPGDVSQLLVEPLRDGELAAHLSLLDRRRARIRREDLLAMAVDAAGDIIELSDATMALQYVNPAFTEILGYTAAETVGEPPSALIRAGVLDIFYFAEIQRALLAGEVWNGRLISRTKDGREVHLEATFSPVHDAAGRLTYVVAVKRDVTARLAADKEVREARDAALSANRAKSQFLANMSHELRTPLNAIIGYSEMLEEEAADMGEKTFVSDLKRIRAAGQHLLTLINDVLDISKIEAGKMDLYIEEFVLRDTIQDIASTIRPLVGDKGNVLRLELPDDLGIVTADLVKIRQVILNLLSNANKFTTDGEVTLTARRFPRQGEDWIEVQVKDSGIGMTAEQQAKLFQPFSQADASTTRQFGGTGLGLAISRRFCVMMGGGIHVQSRPDEGSTFTVSLPAVVMPPSGD